MKIKLDHYIAKKVAEVAEKAIMTCIEDNRMSKEFELSDIKGVVHVGRAHGMNYVDSCAYQYSVVLFGRIKLVSGATFIKHLGYINDIQRTIMTSFGSMMMQVQSPQAKIEEVCAAVRLAMESPNEEITFVLHEEVKIKLRYHELNGTFGFCTDIENGDDLIAKHSNYGHDKNSVNPQVTGIMGLLANLVATYRPAKPLEFFITENTVFQDFSNFGGGYPTAMINQNPMMHPGYGPFDAPSNLYNQTTYAGPNFRGMNTNDPNSRF